MKFISNPKLRILHYISHPLLNYVNTITCLLKYFGGSLYRHWTDWKYYYLNVIPFKWTNCSVWMCYLFSSVQFSRSVMSDSWRPHEPQHTRPPCPSPTPGVYPNSCSWTSLVAQTVKRLSTMWETWVRSLGWEDSLEKEMATHSILLPWKSHGRRSLVQATIHGVAKSRARLSNFTLLHFVFIELVMPSNHLILCRPLLLLPSCYLQE